MRGWTPTPSTNPSSVSPSSFTAPGWGRELSTRQCFVALCPAHSLLSRAPFHAKWIRNGGSSPLPNSVSDMGASHHRSRTSLLPFSKSSLTPENGLGTTTPPASLTPSWGLRQGGNRVLRSPTACGAEWGKCQSSDHPGPRPCAGSLQRVHTEEGNMVPQKRVRGSGVT